MNNANGVPQDQTIHSRITTIKSSPLKQTVQQALIDFHETLPTQTPSIDCIYIVGSVLTTDFTDKSDIDILVGLDEQPHENVPEHFFRYFNQYGQSLLEEEISFGFTYVDVCEVNATTHIKNNLSRPYCKY